MNDKVVSIGCPSGFETDYERISKLNHELHEKCVSLGADGMRDLINKYEVVCDWLVQNGMAKFEDGKIFLINGSDWFEAF